MGASAPGGSSELPWTFERAALLDARASPGEIMGGSFVPVARSTWAHGALIGTVAFLLGEWTRRTSGWSAAVRPGAKLKRGPDVLRGPDVGIVREERVPTGKGAEGWLEGAPDVAVEVVGASQSATSLLQKAFEYLRAGSQQVWIVDADAERLLVLTPPDHIQILGPTDVLDGDTVLPGFRCEVAELFRT